MCKMVDAQFMECQKLDNFSMNIRSSIKEKVYEVVHVVEDGCKIKCERDWWYRGRGCTQLDLRTLNW